MARMRPRRRARIPGSTARASEEGAGQVHLEHAAPGAPARGPRRVRAPGCPAACTSTSQGPSTRSCDGAAGAPRPPRTDTSPATASAAAARRRPPRRARRRSARRRSPARRGRVSSRATAAPMPLPPPVTMAVRPSSRPPGPAAHRLPSPGAAALARGDAAGPAAARPRSAAIDAGEGLGVGPRLAAPLAPHREAHLLGVEDAGRAARSQVVAPGRRPPAGPGPPG